MIPNTEQRIDEHLAEQEAVTIPPVCELTAINEALDTLDVPRTYPGSEVPCSTRERVRILVNLCLLIGVKCQDIDYTEVY